MNRLAGESSRNVRLPGINWLGLCVCIVFSFVSVNQGFAQTAILEGNVLRIPQVNFGTQRFRLDLQLNRNSNPLEFEILSVGELGADVTSSPSSFDGLRLKIPELVVDGIRYWLDLAITATEPPRLIFADAGLTADTGPIPADPSCQRPPQDISHGPDNPTISGGFSVNTRRLLDGGPAPDGIPPIGNPQFTQDLSSTPLFPDDLVVGIKIGNEVRAYPHRILDWHEVINDRFTVNGQQEPFTLSYCPLTGSAMLWKGLMDLANPTFGTSGLLFNSNLVLYDRQTRSLWSQMLEQAINGPQLLGIPDRVQVIETTWATWSAMYPETIVMTENTGFSRPYGVYPYGGFRTNQALLFPVDNSNDRRLHPKERVVGINVSNTSKVYPIADFGAGVSVINDSVGIMDVVAVGSADQNFGAVFNRQLEDCTLLDFAPLQNQLPLVMTDNEGNQWDVFGNAISGPRAGSQLQKTNSYIAYWFAWTAFFANAEIHQQ